MKKIILTLLIFTTIFITTSSIQAHKGFSVGTCEQCKLIQENLSEEFTDITSFEIHEQICKKIEAGKYTEAAENLKKYIPEDVYNVVKTAIFNADIKNKTKKFINNLPEDVKNDKRSFLKAVGNFILATIKIILTSLKVILISSGCLILVVILVFLIVKGGAKALDSTGDYNCEDALHETFKETPLNKLFPRTSLIDRAKRKTKSFFDKAEDALEN